MATKAVVFGLGAFGGYMAEALYAEGYEVLGIDQDAELVQHLKDRMTQTVTVNVRDRDALRSLGIAEMDLAVVAMGDSVATSILLVQHLAKLGIPRIVAKAMSEEHAEALESVGATAVAFPERDAARRLARLISRPNVLDYIPLEEGYSIIDLVVPGSFSGKTLGELHVRHRFGVSVLAVQQPGDGEHGPGIVSSPAADFQLEAGQTLLLYGADADLDRIRAVT